MGPALVALSHSQLATLGLPVSALASDAPSPPLEVHMAVNARCGAGCKGCYLDAVADGSEVTRERIEEELRDIAAHGVFTVAFGGGEPTLRADLGDLADFARSLGIAPVVTTSGLGLSDAKLEALTHFDQVNVSLDGIGDAYESVRGFDGSTAALTAIEMLSARGVRVGINMVMTQKSFDAVEATIAAAALRGALETQLLRYKPAGRAESVAYFEERLTAAQVLAFPALLRRLHASGYSARIDCSLVPFLSSDPDLYARSADLLRFGILGCEAGEALLAFRSDGFAAGCSFTTPSLARDVRATFSDPSLSSWRKARGAPREPCASCNFRPVCKGGCAVVRRFVEGNDGPDPECPRVRAHGHVEKRRLPTIDSRSVG